MNIISFIKSIVKGCFPFYNSYIKSVQSGIHNQSYFGYIIYRISGRCNGGGITQYTKLVLLPT